MPSPHKSSPFSPQTHRKVTCWQVGGGGSSETAPLSPPVNLFFPSLSLSTPLPPPLCDSQTCFTFLTGFINALHGLLNSPPPHRATSIENLSNEISSVRFCLPDFPL